MVRYSMVCHSLYCMVHHTLYSLPTLIGIGALPLRLRFCTCLAIACAVTQGTVTQGISLAEGNEHTDSMG